nr:MAG TPA: hypothetical protein [Caudoviricetes sp.]
MNGCWYNWVWLDFNIVCFVILWFYISVGDRLETIIRTIH